MKFWESLISPYVVVNSPDEERLEASCKPALPTSPQRFDALDPEGQQTLSCSSPHAGPAEHDQFLGMFRQGQAEGVDSPLHFIDINVGQRQRIMQENTFPCLIEHKRPVHQGAIHLEEASKELARTHRHVQNPLFEEEHGVITIQDKALPSKSLWQLWDLYLDSHRVLFQTWL